MFASDACKLSKDLNTSHIVFVVIFQSALTISTYTIYICKLCLDLRSNYIGLYKLSTRSNIIHLHVSVLCCIFAFGTS